MFEYLANPVVFIIVTLVLCIALYGVLHQHDLRRGESLGVVEEKGLDHCCQDHELVQVGRQIRLVALIYSQDGLEVSRLKILATVRHQGSMRANLEALQAVRGSQRLWLANKTMADLVPARFAQD